MQRPEWGQRPQLRLWLALAASAVLLSGCGSDSATNPPEDPGAGVSIPLEAYNESGLDGAKALLTPLGAKRTRIQVDGIVEASGFGGGPHRAELIRGNCDEPGQRAADLGAVRNERAGAEVDFGLPELTQSEFVVAVWFLADSERTLIACGAIPDSVETSG